MLTAVKGKVPVDMNKAHPYRFITVGALVLPSIRSRVYSELGVCSRLEGTSMTPFRGGFLRAPEF